MSFSDFLRRLSNTLFGWPKIDESPLVFPDEDKPAPIPFSKQTTSLSTYPPLILLILDSEPEGLIGNRVIRDIGGTLESTLTKDDLALAATDSGINLLWTQCVRVSAKNLVERGLMLITGNDLWQITSLGRRCANAIATGQNDAWRHYGDPEAFVEPEPPKPAVPVLIPDVPPVPVQEDMFAAQIKTATIVGNKIFTDETVEITLPMPKFPPLGIDENNQYYHRSAEINILALWFILYEYKGQYVTELPAKVNQWYQDKLTPSDKLEVSQYKTRFSRYIGNLFHDLKRQKLLQEDEVSGTYHITAKGIQTIIQALKEQGVP